MSHFGESVTMTASYCKSPQISQAQIAHCTTMAVIPDATCQMMCRRFMRFNVATPGADLKNIPAMGGF